MDWMDATTAWRYVSNRDKKEKANGNDEQQLTMVKTQTDFYENETCVAVD
jgi:hypothetical protein